MGPVITPLITANVVPVVSMFGQHRRQSLDELDEPSWEAVIRL